MKIATKRIELTKRHPLTISRGTIYGSTNLVVRVEHDGVVGYGEMAPSDVTGDTTESASALLDTWEPLLADLGPWEMDRIAACVMSADGHGSATRAALDLACYDWLGKRTNMSVAALLGIDATRAVPTSLTIGIDSADVLRTKVPEILRRTGAHVLKVKLGQPDGIEADQAMFAVVQEAAALVASVDGAAPTWRVDANCGWAIDDARTIIPWLVDRGVEMIEQPLAEGEEELMAGVRSVSTVPVILAESIHNAADIARFADLADGVNLKLMKTGGIREGLRLIHTARAHRKMVMIGCMGESSLAIAGGAQLGGLVDALDLDSHLNLVNDPFRGMEIVEGRVLANTVSGLGVQWINADDETEGWS